MSATIECIGLADPDVEMGSELYWDGCREGELRVQLCPACGYRQLPWRSRCAECWQGQLGYEVLSGRGRVLTFTDVYRPPEPMFQSAVPYTIVLIGLDEGPRLMSRLVGSSGSVRIDDPVDVRFAATVSGKFVLPVFVLAEDD